MVSRQTKILEKEEIIEMIRNHLFQIIAYRMEFTNMSHLCSVKTYNREIYFKMSIISEKYNLGII